MVIVNFQHHVLCDLALNSNAETQSVRCLEGLINHGGIQVRWNDGIAEISERAPVEVTVRLTDSRCSRREVLFRRQARESLDVIDRDHGVGRDRSVPRGNHVVEPVHSDERQTRRKRTGKIRRSYLGIR